MACKVFQILKTDNKSKATSCLKSPFLYDVYVQILQDKNDTAICKVIYYKEKPKFIPSLYLGRRIEINKKLLIPTEVFPSYSNNIQSWLDRVKKFDNYENLKEVAKDVLSKVTAESSDIITSVTEYIENDGSSVTAAISTKRVYITEKLIKTGRVFISRLHKIKIDKVSGNFLWYTIDGDIKNPIRDSITNIIKLLNQGLYETYPFWVDISRDIQRILKPYIGLSAVSWVITWIFEQLGIEQ